MAANMVAAGESYPFEDGSDDHFHVANPGAPERRVPPTPKEGEMKGCVSKNNRGKACQAQVAPGTNRCVYHEEVKCVTVKRTKDGKSQAVALLLQSCLTSRAKVRVAFANHGTGENAQTPKFHDWMHVNAVNPRPQQPYRDYGVKLSGFKAQHSHRSYLVVEAEVAAD